MLIRLDMGDYAMGNLYKVSRSDEYNMLNINQLNFAIQDLFKKYRKRQNEVSNTMRNKFFCLKTNDSLNFVNNNPDLAVECRLERRYLFRALNNSIHFAQSNRDFMKQVESEFEWRRQIIARHFLEFHKKFSISIACILLFFIGAPLGAIIQKGGFGLPFVISVLLFLFHYVLTIIFEKMGREWIVTPFWAIWMPNLVLLPISFWMTVWAANDANMHSFKRLILKLFESRSKRFS
jgi:lipopolysaccharide export system permease protein